MAASQQQQQPPQPAQLSLGAAAPFVPADVGIFPTLSGQGWSVKKTPTFQTRIQRSVSGRELRLLDYPFPLWQFELTFNALGDNLGVTGSVTQIGQLLQTDLRTLMGFYGACQGAFGTFLYFDPTDNEVTGQEIGIGDGASTTVQLQRTFGPPGVGASQFTEYIYSHKGVAAVYLDGLIVGVRGSPYQYTIGRTGIITFNQPVPAGFVITADFSYYFRCRFMSDSYQFENFMFALWSLKKLDFISVVQ